MLLRLSEDWRHLQLSWGLVRCRLWRKRIQRIPTCLFWTHTCSCWGSDLSLLVTGIGAWGSGCVLRASFQTLDSLSSSHSWGHKRRLEVSHASVNIVHMCLLLWGQVADARTPLLKFKIEHEILVLWSSCLGKNYSEIVGLKPRKNPCATHCVFRDEKHQVNGL